MALNTELRRMKALNAKLKILKTLNASVDPHFSHAPPLDPRDSLFICEKIFSFGKVGAATYFIFILKGK